VTQVRESASTGCRFVGLSARQSPYGPGSGSGSTHAAIRALFESEHEHEHEHEHVYEDVHVDVSTTKLRTC